jgi:hypothetical protein
LINPGKTFLRKGAATQRINFSVNSKKRFKRGKPKKSDVNNSKTTQSKAQPKVNTRIQRENKSYQIDSSTTKYF